MTAFLKETRIASPILYWRKDIFFQKDGQIQGNLEVIVYIYFFLIGQYVASPVKRIWVDKEDGKKCPIGIPALEDKIVQKAMATILGVVYKGQMFPDMIYG